MGIPTIENGQFPWAASVEALLNYITPGQGDGIATFGDARTRLNAAATSLGLPTIGNDTTAQKRAKINALIDALDIPTDASLYLDFLNGRYFNGTPTDTHATDILALGSGGYETFGPDVLPRTDRGLLTTVGRTNKCTNWNANPTDLTGITKAGDAAATLTVVDDSAEIAAAGLDGICTSGMVYKLDSTGTGGCIAGIGIVGNLNQHVASAWVRGGTGNVASASSSEGSTAFAASEDYQRVECVFTPGTTGRSMTVRSDPGQVVYFILNQLEEGPFATDPIITSGSAVTRPGNTPVIDLTGRLSEGVAGVIAVDVLGVQATDSRVLNIYDADTPNDRMQIALTVGGSVRLNSVTEGTVVGALDSGSWAAGSSLTLAFAISNNFRRFRVIGGSEVGDLLGAWPDTIDSFAIGGAGGSTSSNIYQRTERLALKFGPQDQASFDAMYALAQEWAAE